MFEALREIRPCIKNRLRNFVFIGDLLQNKYNHKGQVKIPSYTQYMSVFDNPAKTLLISVTAFCVNYYLQNKYSNIYKNYSLFIVFIAEKEV